MSTCPVAPLVNIGAVEAQVTSCEPTKVPEALVMFAQNLERYTAEVALVPAILIPYPSCPSNCRLFCAVIPTVEYGHIDNEGIATSPLTVPVTVFIFSEIVAIQKLG